MSKLKTVNIGSKIISSEFHVAIKGTAKHMNG